MYPLGSRQPVVEMTRPNPIFSVTRLRPATTYLVRVAGVNHRGASRPSQLQVVTSTVLTQPQETSAGTIQYTQRFSRYYSEEFCVRPIVSCNALSLSILLLY